MQQRIVATAMEVVENVVFDREAAQDEDELDDQDLRQDRGTLGFALGLARQLPRAPGYVAGWCCARC